MGSTGASVASDQEQREAECAAAAQARADHVASIPRWEYQVKRVGQDKQKGMLGSQRMEQLFNVEGAEGWELVAINEEQRRLSGRYLRGAKSCFRRHRYEGVLEQAGKSRRGVGAPWPQNRVPAPLAARTTVSLWLNVSAERTTVSLWFGTWCPASRPPLKAKAVAESFRAF